MRIHTNTLTLEDLRDALATEKDAGRIAGHVTFKTLAQHGSRTHQTAFEVQLEAAYRDRGRRAGNSGSYGAMRPEYDGYAATYDEWGWLLARLFATDWKLLVGSAKYPVYRDAVDFQIKTGLSYNPIELIAAIEETGDPYPYVMGNAARTKRGYFVGRQGAGRYASVQPYWPHKYAPRTVVHVQTFAHLIPSDVQTFAHA